MMWTQADADAMKAAIRSGRRRVRYKDREVEYHDLTEMRTLLADMQADVDAAGGAPSLFYVVTSKGFG